MALVKEIVRQRGDHEIVLVLNGAFEDTIAPIKAEFAQLLPPDCVRTWYPPTPCAALQIPEWKQRAAETIYECFLASHEPDIILVTSLFEGSGDDVVTSVHQISHGIPTAVILYDLIPYIYKEIYLSNPAVESWYQRKVGHIRRAELLLSISASSGREAITELDFPESQVVNISTACNSNFVPGKISAKRKKELFGRYGIRDSFIMYTGGIDHRKNIEGLIRAYALTSEDFRSAHQLAIVCSLRDEDWDRLSALARSVGVSESQLILTGFVPEDDLVALYQTCSLFVFPSWHEGFGLPALEAMTCGRPTIAANTSSLPEVIGLPEATFDPRSDQSIADLMTKALTDTKFRAKLEKHALKQASKFSWENSAKRAMEAITRLHGTTSGKRPSPQPSVRRKLAFLSPLPSAASGIADYSAELLPELARHYDIEVIVAQEEPLSDQWTNSNLPVRSVEWFKANWNRFDRVMYHFGNSHFHEHMFDLIAEIPGIVVLHDFYLSGVLADAELKARRPHTWTLSLLEDHGWQTAKDRWDRERLHSVIRDFPCNGEVLRNAVGGIVHSEHALDLIEEWHGEGAARKWHNIPLLRCSKTNVYAGSKEETRQKARAELGLGEKDFVICSFGHLGEAKCNDRLLSAWQQSRFPSRRNCKLVFVGANAGGTYGEDMARRVAEIGDAVSITGFVTPAQYQRWLEAADVAVQLRTNSRGETSAALLDCWRVGLVAVVNEHGSLTEVPDDCAIKVPDDFADADLAAVLEELFQSEEMRADYASRGHARLISHHSPRRCADAYAAAIEQSYSRAASGVFGLVDRLASLRSAMSFEDQIEIARAISCNFPPAPRRRRWFVDCTAGTDGEQGQAAELRDLLLEPRADVVVEPVWFDGESGRLMLARRFACNALGVPDEWVIDQEIELWDGDKLLVREGKNDFAQLPHSYRAELVRRGGQFIDFAR